MDAPPEQRFDIAVLAGEFLGLFHIVADAGEAGKIFLDVVARFARAMPSWLARPKAEMP